MKSTDCTKQILMECRNGIYANENRLPPETEIAKEMGVSRTAIRDSLAKLEEEGYISRKHGIGTIINHHVVDISVRMNMYCELSEIIRRSNMTPRLEYVKYDSVLAGPEIAGKMKIKKDDVMIRIERLFSANRKPAIYCEDYVRKSMIRLPYEDKKDLKEPVFVFLKKYADTEMFMNITEVSATSVNSEQSKAFRIPKGKAVLKYIEVGYDFAGNPVLFAKEFFLTDKIKHIMFKKKSLSEIR